MIWFFVGAALLVTMLGGVYLLWSRKIAIEVAEGSAVEWERLKECDPALIEGLDKAQFDAIYARVHFPRFPKYALVALAGFVASLPIAFALLFAILWIAEKLHLTPDAKTIANHYLIEKGH
ncbi:MAG TPA: hypothetical protein VNH64_05990, partial [Parvularculaceae bacterium]|nr:hypothetical protein [Parvularculaceae bacterium]